MSDPRQGRAAVPSYFPERTDPQWLPLAPLEQMAQTDYDVLIVGTGAGGGAVLWRLCEGLKDSGKRIGIIEAGDLLLPTHGMNLPTSGWALSSIGNQFFPIGDFLPQYSAARQFFGLGGRTLNWGIAAPRMHWSDMIRWPVPLREMEKYYKIAEQAMFVSHAFAQGSTLSEITINRLWQNGFPESVYLPMAADLAQTKYGELHSNVYFSSILFLARALKLRAYDLAVRARAIQIVTENGKAAGVRAVSPDKKWYDLKAKMVVLSASTLENPRILLNSGIQGHAVGHYLTNHSGVEAWGTMNKEKFPEIAGTLALLVPGTEFRPYQVQIQGFINGGYPFYPSVYHYSIDKPVSDISDYVMWAFGKVESRFENKVGLSPSLRDEYGVPMIEVDFSYSNRDLEVIGQMSQALIQVSEVMDAPINIKDGRLDLSNWIPGRDFHECGTCRMGDNPLTSTTNRFGQVHGVPGLYVADNSVLPSLGAANPTLTAVALAIRTTDYLIEQLK